MSEEQEPKPMHWLTLALLGWFVHVVIAGGMLSRVAMAGPRYEQRYRDYNMRLPDLTEGLLRVTRAGGGAIDPWVFGGFAVLNLAVHICLARWERPTWKYWFWGVLIVLLLGWPLVELILFLPEWKLREGLSR
jgi:hypothetical protein